MRLLKIIKWMGGVIFILLVIACQEEEKDKKVVVCWGDSLTSPHVSNGIKGCVKGWFKPDDSYPAVLQDEIGERYQVVNCGVGGENTLTIMARQGAYPMELAHDVTIYRNSEDGIKRQWSNLKRSFGKYRQYIGNGDVAAFVSSYNGEDVTPMLRQGSSGHINPCIIGNAQYELQSESKMWKEDGAFVHQYNYFIEAAEEPHDSSYIIPAGTKIVTEAMRNLRYPYAQVIFMGQNGGFVNVAELIDQIEAMVKYGGTKRYVVVSFHHPNKVLPNATRMAEMEDSLASVFGSHYINLRRYLIDRGLADAKLVPTQVDKDSIAAKSVPPQLLLPDGLHFNKTGYALIGRLVAKTFQELKY